MNTNSLSSVTPRPQLSVFSYHLCGRNSLRHTGPCLVCPVPVTEPPCKGHSEITGWEKVRRAV